MQSGARFVKVLKVWPSARQKNNCVTVTEFLTAALRGSALNTRVVVSQNSVKAVLTRQDVIYYQLDASHPVANWIAAIQMAAMVVQCLWSASSCLRHAP